MFDAVIFDCDGVLVDSEKLGLEIELAMLAEIGLHYERDDYVARFMGTPLRAWARGVEADQLERTGAPCPDNFMPRLLAAHHAATEGDALTAIDGIESALFALGTPRAVASSSGVRGLKAKLSRTGLWDAFAPHVYSTELVANGKPAPDLFLYAAERLNLTPARCLVIEDSVNGVRAARAAGMEVWGFVGGGHCTPRTANALAEAGAHDVIDHWRIAAERFSAWSGA